MNDYSHLKVEFATLLRQEYLSRSDNDGSPHYRAMAEMYADIASDNLVAMLPVVDRILVREFDSGR